MREPLIACNWKMNTTIDEAIQLIRKIKDEQSGISDVECVICPPFISLQAAFELITGTRIKLGAQNMYHKISGAYTGEISPIMLNKLCEYVIIGHSERRQYFGETDEVINYKVKTALEYKLSPIMCIGESLQENEAGKTNEVLKRQITSGLNSVEENSQLVLAYEPIWAIGTGRAATSKQAGDTIGFIREMLASLWGNCQAHEIRILYGGSVTASNIAEIMSEHEVDGALVGGASLKAAEFTSIVRQAASARVGK